RAVRLRGRVRRQVELAHAIRPVRLLRRERRLLARLRHAPGAGGGSGRRAGGAALGPDAMPDDAEAAAGQRDRDEARDDRACDGGSNAIATKRAHRPPSGRASARASAERVARSTPPRGAWAVDVAACFLAGCSWGGAVADTSGNSASGW